MKWALLSIVLLLVAGYGALRVFAHFSTSRSGMPSRSQCAAAGRHASDKHPVLAFGDSITWGWDASVSCIAFPGRSLRPMSSHRPGAKDTTYPAELARILQMPVLDYGVPGEQAAAARARLCAVLALTRPRTVIILEGINDLVHGGASARQMAKSVLHLASIPAGRGIRTYIVSVLPTYGANARFARRAHDANTFIAAHAPHGARFVNAWPLFTHHPALFADGVHPNDAGYGLLARTIAHALRNP